MANNQLLASDNFASGSLAAGWSALFGLSACKVVSNQTEPNALSTNAGQSWTGGSIFGNDQSSEVTLGTGFVNEAGTIVSLIARAQVGASTYYQAQLANHQLNLYVTTAGSSVQLGSTVNGITIAAGDVWVLQAAGSALSVYQNNTPIITYYDTTITGGTPGYAQYSSVAIAHCTVASWRGYSAVQQDGIWTKSGIVLAPNATDLPDGIECHSPILYEGNAQLLSGTVFKMWFDNFNSLYYAESLDGKNWTRKATALLGPGLVNSAVYKVGSTYYCYIEQNASAVGPIQAYTSSDGINFTQQNASAIAAGSAGAWDSVNLAGLFALTVVGGTWYGFYGGCKSLSTLPFSVGLATSTDGINWTKYGSNPIFTGGNFFGLFPSNGGYYTWAQLTQPGRGASGAPFFDPSESVRYFSTDLLNWTLSSHSTHNMQGFESLNQRQGYCDGGNIINVNGKAYNYLTVGIGDAAGAIIGQTELAIGPSTIQNIVLQPEDGFSQVATDNFTSGAGDLSSNWVTPTGGTKLKIVAGNLCEPTALATNCVMLYTGGMGFYNDQYSEITIKTMAGEPDFDIPVIRGQTNANSFYFVLIDGPTGSAYTSAAIYKKVAGASTQIGPTIPQITPQVGDVFRLSATGSNPVLLSFYQNGFLIQQVEDWSNAFTSGYPGIFLYAQTTLSNAQISLWSGGNANVIPNYPPSSGSSSSWLTTALVSSLRGLRK